MKLPGHVYAVLIGVVIGAVLFSTGQVLPATNEYQAEMRIWLVGRATGIASLILLAAGVVLGILLSHPEQARWKQAKRLYPIHESIWVFTLAFVGAHIVSLAADPYAGVGWTGAFVPGLSSYRTPAVALGTFSAYALVITGFTARFSHRLPSGWWLKLHRFSLVVLGLGWAHGVIAGTDTVALQALYVALGIGVAGIAAYRYWVVRRRTDRHSRADVPVRQSGNSPVVSHHMESSDA